MRGSPEQEAANRASRSPEGPQEGDVTSTPTLGTRQISLEDWRVDTLGKGNTTQKCESGRSWHRCGKTSSSRCQFRTHEKPWLGCPGQMAECVPSRPRRGPAPPVGPGGKTEQQGRQAFGKMGWQDRMEEEAGGSSEERSWEKGRTGLTEEHSPWHHPEGAACGADKLSRHQRPDTGGRGTPATCAGPCPPFPLSPRPSEVPGAGLG